MVLTSDNPRSEDPLAIINDAMVGLQRSGVKYSDGSPTAAKRSPWRSAKARPGDIVLIAGKGTRRCRSRATAPIPFDDVEVAREVLASRRIRVPHGDGRRGKTA